MQWLYSQFTREKLNALKPSCEKTFIFFGSIFLVLLTKAVSADQKCIDQGLIRLPVQQKVQCLLEEFDENPAEFMTRILEKHTLNSQGDYTLPVEPFLTQALKNAEDFVEVKDRLRSYAVGATIEFFGDTGRAPIEANDQAEDLVDSHDGYRSLISSLTEIEAQELLEGRSTTQPWSDFYWPIYQGQLGNRYASDMFADDWIELLKQFFEPLASIFEIVQSQSSADLKNLSPSEKYDLLIGDLTDWDPKSGRGYRSFWQNQASWVTDIPPGYFTPGQWQRGQEYYNKSPQNKIESWMGLCHGWSAASYTMPRPQKTVTVLAADGITPLEFRPSDIKALLSQTWSEAKFRSRFIGGRCNVKEPATDDNGRFIDQNCFDTNPGTWHLTVVNQVGRNKSSFIMDATHDYEVWNFPVVAYKFTYFNPLTKAVETSWQRAAVSITDPEFVAKDRFYKYRFAEEAEYAAFPHKRPAYVVGVGMEVEYVGGSNPSEDDEDSSENDQVYSVTYLYDLEVNASGQIVGGEWYNNNHPDFLWHVPEELVLSKPYYTAADLSLRRITDQEWTKGEKVPELWQQPAKNMAQRNRTLGHIVDQLTEWSQEEQ